MNTINTFIITVIVEPEDGDPYLRDIAVPISDLIHEHGGSVVRYIQEAEALPYEWCFADEDDKVEYDYPDGWEL